jgi:serine/threonine protein kinase
VLQRDHGPKALKILTKDVTGYQGRQAFELEVLKKIASVQSGKAQERLLQLEDHFYVSDEDKKHLCLVTAPLGSSLLAVRQRFESKRLPIPLAKRITCHLLEGLQVLHNQWDTVHTGECFTFWWFPGLILLSQDIKHDNIMLSQGSSSEGDSIDLGKLFEADFVLADFGTGKLSRALLMHVLSPDGP